MTLAATLRDQRKQEAINVIARTALGLFTTNGYDATSVEDIAGAAGCSPRTFYRYFGSKEDVMFHDLPAMTDRLGATLDGYLATGLGPWAAVTEAFVELIKRFDGGDELMATQRMKLWLLEPTLLARYIQYVTRAEQAVADCLHRHRGTTPEKDELAQLIAVAATGAYRVTIMTHMPARSDMKLAKHLRVALATLGEGLADADSAKVRQLRSRTAKDS
jgi:AcrR family transcriptional regulator